MLKSRGLTRDGDDGRDQQEVEEVEEDDEPNVGVLEAVVGGVGGLHWRFRSVLGMQLSACSFRHAILPDSKCQKSTTGGEWKGKIATLATQASRIQHADLAWRMCLCDLQCPQFFRGEARELRKKWAYYQSSVEGLEVLLQYRICDRDRRPDAIGGLLDGGCRSKQPSVAIQMWLSIATTCKH